MTDSPVLAPRATTRDGSYPRPQLLRPQWADLSGPWGFAHDDEDRGRDAGWAAGLETDRTIVVPFPPESALSGIADPGYHPVVWYERALTDEDLALAGFDGAGRLLLHLGAVDYRAEVWLDGALLGRHEGGHTPFAVDLTEPVRAGGRRIVVRAEDDPLDVGQPRGKQDWLPDAHAIWYDRTTGIWQPVWLEAVPDVAIERLHWTADLPNATVGAEIVLSRRPVPGTTCRIELSAEGRAVAAVELPVSAQRFSTVLTLAEQANGQGYEQLLWTPDTPRLIDATVSLTSPGADGDVVESYLGLRSAAVEDGRFLLNDRPCYLRSVLEQGFWPESHLAAPSADAIRAEVQLIKDLGFNAVRLHQKFEDPRFLHWADRIGLLVWGEAPGAYEFSPTAIARTTREWLEVLDRDRSHPSIVTWVPINESWGVQHIAHSPAMRAYARGLADLTRAIDPTRPVVSNDGWEHVDSDVLSVHDYEADPAVVERRYGGADARERLLAQIGPAGRRILLPGAPGGDRPVMLTEFGGIRFSPGADPAGAWGYSSAASADEYRDHLRGLLDAVRASELLAGFCYTQLTDTMQEANGLTTADRTPKLPIEELRAIITGEG